MPAEPVIRSRANPLLKRVGAVRAGRERDVLLLEGERLVRDALRAGHEPELVLVAEDRGALGLPPTLLHGGRVRRVDPELLGKVSSLATSPGVLALLAPPPERALEDLDLPADALVLVLQGLADPGNLGALARSAEAAGARALVLLPGGASPWNPKAVRGSMGSLLRLPVVRAASAEVLARDLDALGFTNVVAATRGGEPYDRADWTVGRLALWAGSETGELPTVCGGFRALTIPMAGEVESLNVTVATSLLLFAAGRVGRGSR